MKKIVIWGAGLLGAQLGSYIRQTGEAQVCAYASSREYCEQDEFEGLPLCPGDELLVRYPPDEYEAACAIGFKKMNDGREKVARELKKMGYTLYTYVHPSCVVNPTARIGEGAIVLEGNIIGLNVTIGEAGVIMRGCVLSHDVNIGDYAYIADGVVFGGNVKVERNCFVGLNATILPGVTLKNHTLVGAGCTIAKNTEAYGVYKSPAAQKLEASSLDKS